MAEAFQFGAERPPAERPHSQIGPLSRGNPFQPLPPPTGAAPYRLDLAKIIPAEAARMRQAGGMVLHMVGDTGGVLNPVPQQLVAKGLEADSGITGSFGKPAFFYHLGDVIYFDGQTQDYYPQFYLPYEYYPLPIMGIPGNHDGDRFDRGSRVSDNPSLTGFTRNFCAAEPGIHNPEAEDIPRTAMIQPNVYWTLETPFATFIGLYTNVPEGGEVHQDQRDWFLGELAAADAGKPVIVAMHHPIHSLDAYHSGSRTMAALLEDAISGTGRTPHLVFAGHVHNYQRFTTTRPDGVLPFIVAGQGGYHNLHRMAKDNGAEIITPYAAPNDPDVVLESYCDDRFGFLRLEISADIVELRAYTVPRPQEAWRTPPRLYDRMRLDWRARKLLV
ncbi:MAG TPA: metallophosphoesterase [Acetobacteraceae bacterium]|nr:metallophosphoesterase [Acetobacteraceae bacterium]